MKRTLEGDNYKKNNPEAFEKLAKAMELSKGKVDTTFGRELAKIANSTPEDIVRLQREDDGNLYGNREVWCQKEDRGDTLKTKQAKEKFRYCFKDTFAYRYMEKLGVVQKVVEKGGLERVIETKGITVDEVHDGGAYNPNRAGQNRVFLQKASYYAYGSVVDEFKTILQVPANIRNKVFKDEFLLDVWTSGKKDLDNFPYWRLNNGRSLSQEERDKLNKEYHRKQNEKKAEELLMLANAPQAIKDAISGFIKSGRGEAALAKECGQWYGHYYEFKTMSAIWYNNSRLEPWKLEKELELEDFYKALSYMGLGIVCLQKERVYERKNIRQFISHVNATTRQFVSDIKKGFDAATVREMVKEDLNLWLKERVKDKWTVFIREDAQASYPDIEVKKKKKPSIKETAEVVTKSANSLIDYINKHSTL